MRPFSSLSSLKLMLLGLAILAQPVMAQSTAVTIDAAERQEVVQSMSNMMIENYVYEDVARKTAEYIQKQLKSGAYDKLDNATDFAEKLTEDVRAINKDKHMRIMGPRPASASDHGQSKAEPTSALVRFFQNSQRRRGDNDGYQKLEILEGNVGYVDFRFFGGGESALNKAAMAMDFVSNTDAVIIDLRKNGGGSPANVQFICSYFFGEKTHLNSLYWRRGDITEEYWTLDEIPGKRMPDVPLYVLTSSYTFSGAEEFSYNMKTRNRATIVGEVTGGGANPGGPMAINDNFRINMPTGRAINPVTGTNWEGVGVKPDVAVDAKSALEKAHELAKAAAKAYRKDQMSGVIAMAEKVDKALTKAEKLLENKQSKQAQAVVNSALGMAVDNGLGGESAVNMLGYDYLMSQAKADMAVLVFTFNTQTYPNSYNTFDSLGEAYMAAGNKKLAKKHYLKSLELNPENSNAKSMLEQL